MSGKPRVIVTTDMEVDDMNSIIHLALYLNELDVEAFVYTSSQYHFLGDGEHTLAEVNPHWRTKGRRAYEWAQVPHEPDPEAGTLTSYRPWPAGWLERLWAHEYAEAWSHLCENAPEGTAYPSPSELVARTFTGNVAFEGDVREPTEGSEVIRHAIMDDDPRTLWLLSWGGANTIVRALMSIAQGCGAADAQGRPTGVSSPEWEATQAKVYGKVRVMGIMGGVGQDNSWEDWGRPLFPKLTLLRAEFAYGGYVDAKFAQPDALPLFRAPWPEEHITRGNGPLMARYMLYGDGKVYEDEPERFQFGTHARLDWGLPGMEPMQFDPGDFMAEGDSMLYIPLIPCGLRGAAEPGFSTILGRLFRDGEKPPALPYDWYRGSVPGAGKALSFDDVAAALTPAGPSPYLRAYQEDFAARAQWCAHKRAICNHAPVIAEVSPDAEAAPGESVELNARVSDPDGDALALCWTVDTLCTSYNGAARNLRVWQPSRAATRFSVPVDAKAGDRFVLTLEVSDAPGAERPMTSYAQVAVAVR